jgi:hypothetical protein
VAARVHSRRCCRSQSPVWGRPPGRSPAHASSRRGLACRSSSPAWRRGAGRRRVRARRGPGGEGECAPWRRSPAPLWCPRVPRRGAGSSVADASGEGLRGRSSPLRGLSLGRRFARRRSPLHHRARGWSVLCRAHSLPRCACSVAARVFGRRAARARSRRAYSVAALRVLGCGEWKSLRDGG